MDIKINRWILIVLSIFMIGINILGMPILFGTLAFINGVNIPIDLWIRLPILDLGYIISFMDNLIFGFWLYHIAKKTSFDKFMWFTIGLFYGQYSILFFLVIMIFENRLPELNLFKVIQTLILCLVIIYFLRFLSNIFISKYTEEVFMPMLNELKNFHLTKAFPAYLLFIELFNNILVFILNIFFVIKIYEWIKDLKLYNKIIWILTTLVFGLFPILIIYKLKIIDKFKNNAA